MRGLSYVALTAYLERSGKSELKMTFDEVKRINGGYLPYSACKHRAWWANDPSHSQAVAWLNAGYKACDVRMEDQIVHFEKL
jgi:hypothetical protein